MPPFSLKTKMTCMVSLLVVALLSIMAFSSLEYFDEQFKETVASQQFTMVSAMADEIDSKLSTIQNELSAVAMEIKPELLANRAKAQRFLDNRFDTRQIFDNGIYIFRPSGRLLAGHPMEPELWTKDYSDREYFREPLASGRPYISKPFFSRQQHRHPVLMFSMPVLDERGRTVAILAGSLDLMKDNFLGKLSTVRIGRGGYLYLYAADRTMIMHPDRGRILRQDVPPGANTLFDRAIKGFEGTGETVTSRKLRTLSSFKRLRSADWILAANYPLAEAFAPIDRAKKFMLAALLAMVSFSVVSVWFFMRHLTSPLLLFTSHVRGISDQSDSHPPIAISANDEIGTLARAFNRMLSRLDEQKQAMQGQLRFLQLLIDTIPHPVFYKDAEGRYLGCNRAFESHLGLTREELIGKSVYDIAPPDLAERYYQADAELFGQQSVQTYESSVQHADGTLRDVVFSKATFPAADGALGGLIGIILDITEQKRTEKEIKHALSLLRATLESTADGILVMDRQKRIISYNRKFAEMWQIPESWLAETDDDRLRAFVLHQLKSPAEFMARVKEINDRPEGESYDVLEFADGRYFERFSKPQTIEEKIVGRVWSFRDITGQRKLENQLRQAQKMEAIGTLTGGIAHDFNNILTAIIGYGNLVQMQTDASDPRSHLLEQMLAAADKASALTKGLLTYSRKQPLNPCQVDLNEIVKRSMKLLSRLISENIEFSSLTTEQKVWVMADSGQIEQVIMNLVTNARDAMPEGGRLAIATDLARPDDTFVRSQGCGLAGTYAILSVSDTGVGMEKVMTERIFEPFFTTKEVGKGTGLGLSIVYGIVKQHNGLIQVESEPGTGSLFKVYLPLSDGPAAEPPAPSHEVKTGGTETILLIEDNPEVRQFLKALLEQYGYRIIEAADGEEAVERFIEQQSDIRLLLLDVIMPKRNGREVYNELKRLRPDIKVLFTSGYSADIISRNGILEEGLDFISKPLAPAALLAKIREVLDT